MEWSKLDESTITELLAAEPCSGAGVILRLAWRAGLMRDEIYALQWKQVDFERALLRLPDRDVPMDEDLMRCLGNGRPFAGNTVPMSSLASISGRICSRSRSRGWRAAR